MTIDELNAYEEKMGFSPFTGMECMTVADGTEMSFSHKHHLALQWGGDRLKAYTGLSYLDQDGPLRGGEGYSRYTGSWSLSWTPVSWITVETTGNYGRSDKATDKSSTHIWNNLLRSSLVSSSSETYDQALGRNYSTFLTGSAGVEIRPLPGLLLRAGGGYSRNGVEAADISWYDNNSWNDTERIYYFSGKDDALDKWHWETEADYTVKFGNGHSLHAGLSYRQRAEDYDLFSVSGQTPISDTGVERGDVPGFLRDFLLPEMERLRSSGMTERGHILSVSPYAYTWKWSEMSARSGSKKL